MPNVLIVGDVHGQYGLFSEFLYERQDLYDIIIQCGDLGFFPKIIDFKIDIPPNKKLYFCPGNHEDWETLINEYNYDDINKREIAENIFYMRRGDTLKIDRKTFAFFGGAESIDKYLRTPGYDWFPEESISQKDLHEIDMRKIELVDYIISHTCPKKFKLDINLKEEYVPQFRSPSMEMLDHILESCYRLKRWFFGHFHKFMYGVYYDLNEISPVVWVCHNELKPRYDGFYTILKLD